MTGGNGFIGAVVVRTLLADGHAVRCLLRSTSRTDRIDGLPIERVYGDVRDGPAVRAALHGCDATIHLASVSSWKHIDSAELTDVVEGGTANVLAAAASHPAHRVLVVSSTTAVNGSDAPEIFDEDSRFTLRDAALTYAHAKRRAEALCRQAYERGTLVVVVNPAEVYGPNDTELVTAGNLVDFARSRPVLVCRGGTAIAYVDDVAAGIVAALLKGRPGERYVLAGDNVTVRALAELCLELTGRRSRIVTVPNGALRALTRVATMLRLPLPYNPHVVPYATRFWFVDSGKAQHELGVEFRGARDTLKPTIAWLKAAGHIA